MKKDKGPKFALCENPMAQDEHPHLYVVHMRDPVIIARVEDVDPDGTQAINGVFIDQTKVLPGEDGAMQVAKIMRQMGDWYHSYCIWEDGQEIPNDYE